MQEGWKDGSAVSEYLQFCKRTCVQFPAEVEELTVTCNSSSEDSSDTYTSLSLCLCLRLSMPHTHTHKPIKSLYFIDAKFPNLEKEVHPGTRSTQNIRQTGPEKKTFITYYSKTLITLNEGWGEGGIESYKKGQVVYKGRPSEQQLIV